MEQIKLELNMGGIFSIEREEMKFFLYFQDW